jgi:dinuclear metal center YbgI/SA1388 family protein
MPAAKEVFLDDIAQYLDAFLRVREIPDFPGAVNGIQMAHHGPVVRIAAAVDASHRAIAGAIAEKANLLLVHHGLFWGGVQPITGPRYERLAPLIAHDIAIYSAHLPLDCHPSLGNNALLARSLQIEPDGVFGHYQGIAIGVSGHGDIPTAALFDRARAFARTHHGEARASAFDPDRRTRHWAIVTGGGASADTLREAAASGIDTLITGEGSHWTAVDAPEQGLTIIYAGHYATEALGVTALTRHVADRFHIPWTFIAAPTGL